MTSRSDVEGRDDESDDGGLPPNQYLAPEVVLVEMARAGARRATSLTTVQVVILSVMAGGFITIGALLSTLLAAGTGNEGVQRLLEGLGFSVGFFLVVLTGALLFTEVNVELPATLLGNQDEADRSRTLRACVLKLWILAAIGNMVGAFVLGQIIGYVSDYGPEVEALLVEVVDGKVRFAAVGGLDGFARAVVSGIVANWLVGMAAFLATMGRTIIGKYIPVLLTVTAFVAGGFLHSPANMAYLSLIGPIGGGPGWADGLLWAVLPAAIGNLVGAFAFVALPFHLATPRAATG